MPVDTGLNKEGMIYQREQYAKGGIGVAYWDFRDRAALSWVTGGTVVDVGCGEGITLERLMAHLPGSEILGIDSEPENIEICRRHRLPVRYGTVYELPLQDASVDCALFCEVIEHLDRPERALQEIWRVLKPGGRLILIFPNDTVFLWARLLTLKTREAFYDAGHVRQWAPATIRQALREAGFAVLSQKSLPFRFWPLSLHHLVAAQKR